MTSRRVTLGRVSGVFGIKGWLRVHSYTRPPENILDYRRWWLSRGEGFETRVLSSQVQNRSLVVQLSDAAGNAIEDREIAAGLIGVEIAVDRDVERKSVVSGKRVSVRVAHGCRWHITKKNRQYEKKK